MGATCVAALDSISVSTHLHAILIASGKAGLRPARSRDKPRHLADWALRLYLLLLAASLPS